MSNYKIDNIRRELQNNANKARAFAAAWGAVVRKFTKGGQPFKVLSKNFDGCNFGADLIGHPVARVCTSADGCGYVSDEIDTRITLHGYGNEKRPDDDSRIISGGPCMCDYYLLNADELAQAIADRAAYWGRAAADYAAQVAACDRACEAYRAALGDALQALQDAAGGRNSLYHAAIKAITEYDVKRG